jgi:hypothetical protein
VVNACSHATFWCFDPGEHVLVHRSQGVEKGVILASIPESALDRPSYVVDLKAQGEHRVPVAEITKDVILGDFVQVQAGIHAGKTGFVVGRVDTLLGICIGQRTNGLVRKLLFFSGKVLISLLGLSGSCKLSESH